MRLPRPRYDHLLDLVDDTGLFEHSFYGLPRRDHGYTLDDVSRALVLLCESPSDEKLPAIGTLTGFVIDACRPDGTFHNRMDYRRRWTDDGGPDDTQGRGIWALAVAAVHAPRPDWRQAAAATLGAVATLESPFLRPHAYAALGSQALSTDPQHAELAERLARSAAAGLEPFRTPWPEARLTYANARIPDGLMAAGQVLGRTDLIEQGLDLLDWLETRERFEDRYSFTPVGGQAVEDDGGPGFDQQPIEPMALAAAAERAWHVTGDQRWREAVLRCGRWFAGVNDVGVEIYDPATGGGRDGLTDTGANDNRGAESTIAALSVLEACARLAPAARPPAPTRDLVRSS